MNIAVITWNRWKDSWFCREKKKVKEENEKSAKKLASVIAEKENRCKDLHILESHKVLCHFA